jgi:F5/8 type C domain
MTIHINIRKTIAFLVAIFIVLGLLWFVDAMAAPFPAAIGGTGTSQIPASGTIPIGTGSGTYAPNYLLCSGNCTITSASGTVTVNVPADATSTVTIYPVSVATNTFSIVGDGTYITVSNPSTSTIKVALSPSAVLNLLSAASPIGYNTSTGQFSCSTCITTTTGNWQGTWQGYNHSDFLSSSTVYVATNTGNWAGTWQNATSGTYYPYSNPLGFVTSTVAATVNLSGSSTAYDLTGWTDTNGDLFPSTPVYISIPYIVPVMSSNTVPSPYVASASSIANSSNDAWRAFDQNTSTKWTSAASVSTSSLEIYTGTSTAFGYTLTGPISGQSSDGPKTWTFQGSNDGSSWTTLDTETNAPTWGTAEQRFYTFSSVQTYNYWRIYITANQGGGYTSITEMNLLSDIGSNSNLVTVSSSLAVNSSTTIGGSLTAGGNISASGSLTVAATSTFANAATIQAFLNGTWINLPTSGPSGIGTGGPGINPFLAYVSGVGNWFSGTQVGDIAIRNTVGDINIGTSSTLPDMVIASGTGAVTINSTLVTNGISNTGNVTSTNGTFSSGLKLPFVTSTILAVDANGNISSSSPINVSGTKVGVAGSTNSRYQVTITPVSGSSIGLGVIGGSGDYTNGIEFGSDSTHAGGIYWIQSGTPHVNITTYANSSPISFGNNWMYMLTNGKVGINTTLPANLLDVNGSADVQGNFAVGTTTTSTATLNDNGSIATLATTTNTSTALNAISLNVFNGTSTATTTLPLISSSTNVEYEFKNIGTATDSIVTATSTQFIYALATSTSYALSPRGHAVTLHNDGTYWEVIGIY